VTFSLYRRLLISTLHCVHTSHRFAWISGSSWGVFAPPPRGDAFIKECDAVSGRIWRTERRTTYVRHWNDVNDLSNAWRHSCSCVTNCNVLCSLFRVVSRDVWQNRLSSEDCVHV